MPVFDLFRFPQRRWFESIRFADVRTGIVPCVSRVKTFSDTL